MPPSYAPTDTRVFVGNLPQGVDKREVEDIFRTFGEVTDIWIARNPETGFGFVYFRDRRDAEDACRECNRREKLGGNVLRVEVSHEQPATDRPRAGKGGKGRRSDFESFDDGGRRDSYRDEGRDGYGARDRDGNGDRKGGGVRDRDRRDDDRYDRSRDDDRRGSRGRDHDDRSYKRASRSRSRSPPRKRNRSRS
eukprot:GGOE01005558.1.p3 GENE.GGOE01005558.1~~GGOE01005558.1.p3  ORF type:complete len:203 (-),score=32.99 GGOE01005558.1:497-1078(-)